MKKNILLLLSFLVLSCSKSDDGFDINKTIDPDPSAGVDVQNFMWKAMNFSEERQSELSSRIDKALRDGAVPIGISVAGAAILLSGLFFFH